MENNALLNDLRSMPEEARIMYLDNAEEEDLQGLLKSLLKEICADEKKTAKMDEISSDKEKCGNYTTSQWIQVLLNIG